MGNRRSLSFALSLVILTLALPAAAQEVELKVYPLNDTEGVISQSDVSVDKGASPDGKNALKITAAEPRVVRLFETGKLDVEDARLIYRARLKCENIKGQVFLEMWCHFPGKGEFFSRGLQNPLSGTTGWVTEETPFFLKKGENPDNVKLNLVVNGTGTVWIQDIRLLKAPLK
jgi:hypothetical protein